MSQTASGALALTTDRRFISVKPGIRERVVLAASNQGGSALSLELVVQGVPENWLSLQPSTLVLSGGESAGVLLTFSPDVDVPTGSYPLTVLMRARNDPELAARLDLALVVGEPVPAAIEPQVQPPRPVPSKRARPAVVPTEVPEFSVPAESPRERQREAIETVGGPLELDLSPPSQIATRSARFTLWVSNRGNTPLDVGLYGHDAKEACEVEASPASLSLSPGGEGMARLVVRPTVPLSTGEERLDFPFTVEGRVRGLDLSAQAQGLLTLVPRPWWMNPLVWIGALAGVLVLILVISLARSVLGGQARAPSRPGTLFYEDFEGRRLDRWVLGPGWQREEDGSNHVLSGQGHDWAALAAEEGWDDYTLRLRLKLLRGAVHLNYRHRWGPIRYFVGIHQEGLYLQKQVYSEFTPLAEAVASHALSEWHQVEIVGRGPQIQVYVDGRLELDFTDPAPLLAGGIAFETLDESYAQIDDIEVIPSR